MTDVIIPKTLEAAIDELVAKMDETSRVYVAGAEAKPGDLHMSTGMALRNDWKLWHDSVLARDFKTRFGLGCADDMSAMILKGVFAKVRGTPYDAETDAAYYRAFWDKQGLDPLTQEPIAKKA